MEYDIIIIGAGVVGLAVASHFAALGFSCLVVERNHSFGMETSSRNSEVIHAGIYYPADSLKSRLCVEGNKLIYDWCFAKNVPHRNIGKYIIAIDETELDELEHIYKNALANNVRGIRRVLIEEFNLLEPNINAVGVLESLSTGIVDSHSLMQSFVDNAEACGADFAFRHTLTQIEPISGGYRAFLFFEDDSVFPISSKYIINTAGLNSDNVAELSGIDLDKEDLRLNYCKGHYFRINSYTQPIANKLVYPVPPKEKIGLGIHLTLDLNGGAKLGPDTKYINRNNFDYSVDESLRDKFFVAASRYIKNLKIEQLSPDQSGVRPKLQKSGEAFRDFEIRNSVAMPGVINLIGIESPGLTSCLAIAKYLEKYIT